ncbi:hypothetical protein BRC78_05935 [Halobacteriales archaeon QH_8_68_33]|nr:MAG: hypothetical protein BRC78_05935 [Halobacteriales archaeon QH_8_68_33]
MAPAASNAHLTGWSASAQRAVTTATGLPSAVVRSTPAVSSNSPAARSRTNVRAVTASFGVGLAVSVGGSVGVAVGDAVGIVVAVGGAASVGVGAGVAVSFVDSLLVIGRGLRLDLWD